MNAPMLLRALTTLTTLAIVPLLAGCAQSARQVAPPMPELPTQWRAADTSSVVSEPKSQGDPTRSDRIQWWQAFGDASLDALIEEALAKNADLADAAILVRRARIEAGLVGARLGPQASMGISADAARDLDTGHAGVRSGVNGTVSYELDLWGKLAARRDEAAWRAHASEADREAAALALIGATAKLYWRIGHLNEVMALGQAAIVDAERIVSIAEARLAAGASSSLDVVEARQQLAQVRADVLLWQQQREAKRNALALLLGTAPESRRAEPIDLSSSVVPKVPPRAPALMLAHRPDVRAAEWRLRAQLARIDFSRASLYPSFTLTGEFGTSSDMLVRAVQNPVASIGAAIALPFLQWNTLQLNTALANVDFERASVDFRRVLYRALADVEDALVVKAQLDSAASIRWQAASDAAMASALVRTRYENGAIDIAPLLDARRGERKAQLDRAANRLARLENRMDLFLALGGA
ncbi:MAG TPA: TolC family protein [Trinickia sp.]|nr:TolC family protein [Trinickia sp.]